ncbi:hypothetical protein SAMN05661096_03388 [Marivirga sericea]|uniref:Uncharacterized protein n=1 Tax=Marivirga sericea TaxID=1028 RepID=A0A1X7L1A9_9BACT|nr:hypothetical protein [Marivirga sericea]SMG47407.1 hypothetical protein SAMN05661096_03388 [Marivirga sericea]
MKLLQTGVLLVAVFFFSVTAYSQIGNINEFGGGKPIMMKKYSKIEGTPYYFGSDNWMDGTLYTADGKMVEDIPIRFNGFDNEVEYRKDGNVLIIDNYNLKGFDFYYSEESGGKKTKYEFRNGFSVPGEIEKTDFYNVIYQGDNLSLIEEFKVLETRVTPASYGASEYRKFVNDRKTYLILNNKLDKFKSRKRDFYDIAPNQKSEIKKQIKKNDLDLNNPSHVTFLLEYIDNNLIQ